MRTTFYDYCVEQGKAGLLAQWHPTKNEPLTPRGISYGSKRKIWWRCEKGHAWQAAVYTRTGGSGHGPGRMIWRPRDLIWPPSGIPQKTAA